MTMNSLWSLRDWFTIYEAAQQLSVRRGEPISVADVLRLVLDDHLALSVYLPSEVTAECGRKQAADGSIEERRRPIQGLFDVPIQGRAKLQIEHNHQWERSGNFVPLGQPVGAMVRDGEWLCKLPYDHGESGMHGRSQSEFPRASVLCIRKAALEEFTRDHPVDAAANAGNLQGAGSVQPSSDQKELDKALTTKERATLLVIIEALARQQDIDTKMPAKAAGQIEALTTSIGARIAQRTIQDYLKRIPEAMERRGKL